MKTKMYFKMSFAAAILGAAFVSSALAANEKSPIIPPGHTYVGSPNTNTNTASGGQGGAGGTAIAVTGPNTNTNTSSNRNDNTNVNSNKQAQGQIQGQMQGQGQGQSQTAKGGNAAQGQAQSTDNANNAAQATNVTVNGDVYQAQERNPVNTAYAPSISPTAVCALSWSGGASGAFISLSGGGSYIDKNCELLEQIRAVNSIGDREVASEMLMSIPAYAAAKQRVVDRKTGKPVATAPKVVDTTIDNSAVAANSRGESLDPFVRSRLGLAPLK